MSAVPIGLLFGTFYYLIQIEFQLSIFIETMRSNSAYILLVAIFMVIVYICLWKGLKRALKEHSITRFIIVVEELRTNKKLPSKLSSIFEEYFEK